MYWRVYVKLYVVENESIHKIKNIKIIKNVKDSIPL